MIGKTRYRPVRLLTRSGSGPTHPLVERRRVDVSDRDQLRPHLEGAAAVHHCIHGSKYRASAWRAELPGIRAYFESFGERMPRELLEQLDALEARLS